MVMAQASVIARRASETGEPGEWKAWDRVSS